MDQRLRDLLEAATAPAPQAAEIAALPLPESMRAAVVRRGEVEMFAGVASQDKDPRASLHVQQVPLPPLGSNECLIAPMASALNFNTVWTALFEPVPTFTFLRKLSRESDLGRRHDLDHHIVGSDASGVVLRVGPGVSRWRPGDRVTVHCNDVDLEGPEGHDDSMLAAHQRIWGFETNFGGLAEVSLVKANQLMPMPTHLDWEEAASLSLTLATAYRMIVSPNAGAMSKVMWC